MDGTTFANALTCGVCYRKAPGDKTCIVCLVSEGHVGNESRRIKKVESWPTNAW